MSDRSADLAERLRAGLAALREGRPRDAVAPLAEVCDDRELARADDLRDVRARALSLLAQALLGAGRPADGLARAEAALRLARELGDTEGVLEIEALREQLAAAAAKMPPPVSPRLAEATIAEIEATVRDPRARAEALLRKAGVDAEAGRPTAEEAARRALALAPGDVRIEVLARLVLARVRPETAEREVHAALALADEADEHNLVATITRTAQLLGVALPIQRGPELRRKG